MKLTVIHNDTQIQISGVKSLKKAKKAVKDILKRLPEATTVQEEESNPIGFSVGASIERSEEPVYIYEEEE